MSFLYRRARRKEWSYSPPGGGGELHVRVLKVHRHSPDLATCVADAGF